ncbi:MULTISPECIES: ester cyclase [unclassified Mycobacterium]|uniref:ester cyclase n=1 Tax=unclassified Mycobacterium TaxID=2642494 RepID=UPI00040D010F|nr:MULTISPECIES: ester cyclase [unclassified Mycobacterium]
MTNRYAIPSIEVLRAREQLVLDHFRDEVRQHWDDVLATFGHPHYEIIPTLTVHDGDAEVRGYYHDTRVAFPDQNHEIIALRHSADAVIVEFWLTGTHLGPLGTVPATGSRHRTRMTAYFVFDEQENLAIERIYFDTLSMVKQLIAGINLRAPRSWLLVIRVVRGLLRMSGAPDAGLVDTPPADLSH